MILKTFGISPASTERPATSQNDDTNFSWFSVSISQGTILNKPPGFSLTLMEVCSMGMLPIPLSVSESGRNGAEGRFSSNNFLLGVPFGKCFERS